MNQIIFLIRNGVEVHVFSLYPGDFKNLHSQFKGYYLEEKVTYIANIPSSPTKRLIEAFIFFKKEMDWNNIYMGIKTINPFYFGFSALKLTYLLYFSRLKNVEKYDLVHIHFGNMGVFYTKFFSSGFFNQLPYLVSFHGFDLVPNQTEINRQRYKKMLHSAKFFTVNSIYTRLLLEKVDSSIVQQIKLLPESLDTSIFDSSQYSNATQQENIFRLVYVGRLVGWKGPDRAIEIIEKLVNEYGLKNIELTIIGKGPLQVDLEKMVLEKDLNDHVKLIGGQDQSTIKSILNQSDLFLYTGRKESKTDRAENQGLVLMEAQSMGVPVVAFEVGGIKEGLIHGKTGILVESENIEEYTESVFSLILDKSKRLSMGIAARKFVKEKFDTQVLGHQLLDIYQEVLR